mgnify:CR=1 FL=1
MHCDFNFSDAARCFDLQQRMRVSRLALEEVYSLHKLYPKTEELDLVINHYDYDKDGLLSVSIELKNMLLPRD